MTAGGALPPGARRGAIYGLLAAALFGLSTPVAKRILAEVTPQVLAGLLYLGAGLSLAGYRWLRPSTHETPIRRSDASSLLGVIVLGGVLGPVLMLVGLRRVAAVTGSLLLNLEAPFTILVAALVFREHLGRHAAIAGVFVVAGAATLRLEPGLASTDPIGMLCIAGACLCWALDNNLTQRLTLRDPIAIVRLKALGAGTFNLLLGLALGGRMPSVLGAVVALALGSFSYGVSVVLDAYALRLVGAAREAAFFASAPFVGALASTVIVGESLKWVDIAAMAVMALGIGLLLRERHGHRHEHGELPHDHMHEHDEHHQHEHRPSDPPGESHAHPHRHTQLVHDHPHVPDVHHRHGH